MIDYNELAKEAHQIVTDQGIEIPYALEEVKIRHNLDDNETEKLMEAYESVYCDNYDFDGTEGNFENYGEGYGDNQEEILVDGDDFLGDESESDDLWFND